MLSHFVKCLSNDLFDVYCSYKESKEILDSLILKYTVEDMVRQRFIIANYYRWIMNEEKDIKIQINEYQNLLEDLKTKNISLLDQFVYELLITHKHTSLSDLITHIVIEDTNRKESVAARTKAMYAKANTVQDKPFHKRYADKIDHNTKNKYKYNNPRAAPSNLIPRAPTSNFFQEKWSLFCLWEARTFCSLVQVQSCEK